MGLGTRGERYTCTRFRSMPRSKRLKPPAPDSSVEELQKWLVTRMRSQALRDANRKEPSGAQRRLEEEQTERAGAFAHQAAVDRERLAQRGGFAEMLPCDDDDPITKAILAGEITDPMEAWDRRLRAAGWWTADETPA